jgi:hypothetical protein
MSLKPRTIFVSYGTEDQLGKHVIGISSFPPKGSYHMALVGWFI